MQPGQLGSSRTSLQSNHLLQAPDSFIRAPLPGMLNGTAIIHAGPALGARFAQYSAELLPGGRLGPTDAQRFVYVISGQIDLGEKSLKAGGYGYVPQGEKPDVIAAEESLLSVIEKPYRPIGGSGPSCFTGDVGDIKPQPLMGDEGVLVQALIPDSPTCDFAVNVMTFVPGASLGLVESHIMEHGLLMLQGGGIYRLDDCWYPVLAGDFIWMAPYCPQWFGALGKVPAKYLIYKDWNRNPL
jgi:(S)-ureidoglycine aminohydrolase